MIRAVSNSSPIIGLSAIGKLNLLWEVFDEVYITEEVFKEVLVNEEMSRVGSKDLKDAVNSGDIKLYSVNNKALVDQLYGRLHKGELEVMVAAKELGIKHVIIDDKSARHFAQSMLLKSIGLIGVLLLAKNLKKIDSIGKYLDLLIESGYRVFIKLYNDVLKSAGEI